jgi:hypothetical protein
MMPSVVYYVDKKSMYSSIDTPSPTLAALWRQVCNLRTAYAVYDSKTIDEVSLVTKAKGMNS